MNNKTNERKQKESKYYGEILYLDLNELIDVKSAMQISHVDFYEY
jgi:hypothetical protein